MVLEAAFRGIRTEDTTVPFRHGGAVEVLRGERTYDLSGALGTLTRRGCT